jgi:DNA-binding NarL/FixJ family response regulator
MSASEQLSYQVRRKATALRTLVDAISTRWEEMDDRGRLNTVRQIQLLSLDLGQLADRSRPNSGPTTFNGGSPWFDGLIFLTRREYEVLRALSLGASTRRIGELFDISMATVRSHVKSILAKLGVHSRVEAVSLLLTWDTRKQQPA